jgi:glycosyltransferase involved in cell wall biosynthesis
MTPTVSCIIPTLNRGTVLVETIRQLLQQGTRAHEIIVVDQTSEPEAGTEATLKEWNDQGRIRWIPLREPNASKARNVGALIATGDVLLFLDDDIEIGPDFLAAHSRNYLDSKAVAVSGQVLEMEKEVTTRLRARSNDPDIGWIHFPKNYGERCTTSWMAGGNFSIRREIYFEVGGMDENYKRGAFREETDFAMRFLQAGYRFQFDPAASVVHLGVRAVPRGGARSWRNPFEWHHHIGDWYFNFRFINRRNMRQLLLYSIRHLVVSRQKVQRPWLMLISLAAWFSAVPIALVLCLRGARLIPKSVTEPSTAFASKPH